MSNSVNTKKVPHPEFARRMQAACDGNPRVPLPNHGRLGWFVDEIEKKSGDTVTIETVRKWFAGETIPRKQMMLNLASVLDVDHAWLAVGRSPEATEKQQKVRNAMADGAVNLVAGLIQICGGSPAFPTDGDARAQKSRIDLYAVIKGAQYAFHVAMGETTGNGVQFAAPIAAVEEALVIGVVRTEELAFRFFELDRDLIETQGKRKGDHYTLVMPERPGAEWKEILTFANRL